jgi:hypothetical protein
MRTLNCDTPRGREFEKHEKKAISFIQKERGIIITSTRSENNEESKTLEQDFFISKKDKEGFYKLAAVGEIKNRDEFIHGSGIPLTLEKLKGNGPRGGYMISLKKLESGRDLSKALRVPFVVIANLINDKYILCWKLTNSKGQWTNKPKSYKETTEKNCNGGTKQDDVVYLKLDDTLFQLEKNYN